MPSFRLFEALWDDLWLFVTPGNSFFEDEEAEVGAGVEGPNACWMRLCFVGTPLSRQPRAKPPSTRVPRARLAGLLAPPVFRTPDRAASSRTSA